MSTETLEMFPEPLEYKGQEKIIDLCIESESQLSDFLRDRGFTIGDLSYRESGKNWNGGKAKKLLKTRKVGIPMVSFFTGCGGVDLGFESAGYEHKAGFELNELFCKTLRSNRPKWKIFGPPTHSGDVSDVAGCCDELSKVIRKPFNGVFIGGPPCQPFSIAANQRFSKSGDGFKRTGFNHKKNGGLLFDYLKIVREFRPKVFMVENVPGLRDIDGGEQLEEAITMMESSGYQVETPMILDASDYGIPQNRKRLILIGHRSRSKFSWPLRNSTKIGCGSVLSSDVSHLQNSEIRAHNAQSIKRYMVLEYGKRDQLGRVDRLNPELPSKTVIAGGLHGGGRSHLHPEIPRTLSVRECAMLQTFPNDYVFKGPTARQFTQVGNAVPPVLAMQLAMQIAKLF